MLVNKPSLNRFGAFTALACLLVGFSGFSQISEPGTPYSFRQESARAGNEKSFYVDALRPNNSRATKLDSIGNTIAIQGGSRNIKNNQSVRPSLLQKSISRAGLHHHDTEVLAAPRMAEVIEEDTENEIKGRPYRIGINIPLDIDSRSRGTWTELPDGGKLWQLTINVPGALALGIYYNKVHLPRGGELYLYNANRKHVLGAYTSRTPQIYATEMVEGESTTFEYYSPPETETLPVIEISDVVYIYRGIGDRFDGIRSGGGSRAQSCQVDVACSPEIDGWEAQRDGVIRYTFQVGTGTFVCSASLINNTELDCTPYVLTASHCGEFTSTEEYNTAVWYFKYERPTCDPGNIIQFTPPSTTMTGAIFRASAVNGTHTPPTNQFDQVYGTDFCLVELTTAVPLSYSPYFAGWDRSPIAAQSGVSIHHPAGHEKKISTFTNTLLTGTFNSGLVNAMWRVLWAATDNGHGVTEPGSSGSPIFDQNGRITGMLSGGASSCTNTSNLDLYGKFSRSWTEIGNGPSSQLAPWLDPTSTGVTFLDGTYAPCGASAPFVDFTADQTTINVGEIVQLTDLSLAGPTSWLWTISPGTAGVEWQFVGGTSATDANPQVQFDTEGLYTIALTATNAEGSNTESKVNYINVVGPNNPCVAGSSTPCDEYIALVELHTMANLSGCSSYSDFTSLETELIPGNTYALDVYSAIVGQNFPFVIYNGNRIAAWIDWNNDGIFENPGERVLYQNITGGPFSYPFSSLVQVPLTQTPGDIRMRVRLTFGNTGGQAGGIGPCGITPYGETEDYTLRIVDPNAEVDDYCDAGSTTCDGPADEFLSRFSIYEGVDIIEENLIYENETGCDNYALYNESPTELVRNETYLLSSIIQVGTTPNAVYPFDQLAMWADWNGDGDFYGPGEYLFHTTFGWDAPINYVETTVPIDAPYGFTRIRVRLSYHPDDGPISPCGITTWGEVEDYVVEIVPPPIENYRPSAPNVDFTTDGAWEKFEGGLWVPNQPGPQNLYRPPLVITIDQLGITGGQSALNSYKDITITGAGELILEDTYPTPSQFLYPNTSLVVESGGVLRIEGDVKLAENSNITVESGGTMHLNHDGLHSAHPFWGGVEDFLTGSTVIVEDWSWDATAGVEALVVDDQISPNGDGALFGQLEFNGLPTQTFAIYGGASAVQLTSESIIIANQSETIPVSLMWSPANPNVQIGSDLIHSAGFFSLSGSDALSGINQSSTIIGDLISTGHKIKAYHHPANIDAADVSIAVQGNIDIQTTELLFDASGAATTPTAQILLTGGTPQTIDIGPNVQRVGISVEPDASAVLMNQDLKFGGQSRLSIAGGATFNFGFNGDIALNLTATSTSNAFFAAAGSYLYITSPLGLSANADIPGNVTGIAASNRTANQTGTTFHYIGKGLSQASGDLFSAGSTSKTIVVELEQNDAVLSLQNTTGIAAPGKLHILNGIFSEDNSAYISTSSGNFEMDGGSFHSKVTSATMAPVPGLEGTYTLTDGTVRLDATGDQQLRGNRTYHRLTFAGNGTKSLNNTNLVINEMLSITEDAVFDSENRTVDGSGSLTMDGGRWRLRKLSTTLPELTTPYAINGGTIELYGTGEGQFLRLRGGQTYHHVDINADAANTNPLVGNATLSSSITVTGDFSVHAPARLRLDAGNAISGSGNFNLLTGSGLYYANQFGINVTGTGPAAGHIRVSGTRTFETETHIGFIGAANMSSGDALPAVVADLITNKSSPLLEVSLAQNVVVNGVLRLESGLLVPPTAGYVEVSASGSTTGGSEMSYVDGTMRKAGDSDFLFPVGDAGFYQPIGISDITASSTFEASYIAQTAPVTPTLGAYNPPAQPISTCDHWVLEPIVGTGSANIMLTYGNNPCNFIPNEPGGYDLMSMRWYNGIDTWFPPTGVDPNTYGQVVTTSPTDDFGIYALASASSNLNVLPVTWLSFNAEKADHSALLEWATGSETNNHYFSIERSGSAFSFEPIGTISGQGNSSEVSQYKFIDDSPLNGINYYRLRQVDFDGKYNYSETKALRFEGGQTGILSAHISNGTMRLWLENMPGHVQIEVLSIQGQYLGQLTQTNAAEYIEADWPFAPGVYLIRASSGSHTSMVKVVGL